MGYTHSITYLGHGLLANEYSVDLQLHGVTYVQKCVYLDACSIVANVMKCPFRSTSKPSL